MIPRPLLRSPLRQAATWSLAATVAHLPVNAQEQTQSAIPPTVSAADYTDLLERPPFRRLLSLSESLVLSGVATLGSKKLVTIWNRATSESLVVTSSPNPQGWRLAELVESTDLRHVTATIEVGSQQVTLRFDPERLAPPKLDNTSKPAKRREESVVVEAMLRSLDPAAARQFETLPAAPQESFRKSLADFLSTYPTAPDSRRLAFVRQALEEAGEAAPNEEIPASTPAPSDTPTPTPPAAPGP